MKRANVGERVGALMFVENGVAKLFGYGVRMEDAVPDGAVGYVPKVLRQNGTKNPCIRLDSGKLVYGCECWWGSEEEIKTMCEKVTVVDVDIDELREKYRKAEEAQNGEGG